MQWLSKHRNSKGVRGSVEYAKCIIPRKIKANTTTHQACSGYHFILILPKCKTREDGHDASQHKPLGTDVLQALLEEYKECAGI